MLSGLICILLANIIHIGLDRELTDSAVQADWYLQQLGDGNRPVPNFWALNKLASGHPDIEQYILQRLKKKGANSPYPVVKCLFNAFQQFNGDQNAQHQRMLAGWECTADINLYIAYLYERPAPEVNASHTERSPPADIDLTPSQLALIKKGLGGSYDVNKLFQIREFQLADIYLFHRLSFSPHHQESINRLLDHWDERLFSASQEQILLNQLKLATIVNGHARLYQDEEVHSYLAYFQSVKYIPNSHFKLSLYKRLAFSTYFTGYYQNTLDFYRNHLLPLADRLADREEQLKIRLDYGSIHFRLNNIQAALNEYEYIYNDSIGIRDGRHHSSLINNLAITYLRSGNFSRYLQLQLDAIEIAGKANYVSGKIDYLTNLYIYNRRNDNWEAALAYLKEAEEIAVASGRYEDLAGIKRSFGTYHRDRLNDFDRAIEYFSVADSLANLLNNYQLIVSIQHEKSQTHRQSGNPSAALEILQHISNIAKDRDDRPTWVDIQTRITELHLSLDEIEEAGPYIVRLQNENLSELNFKIQVRAANALARYYYSLDLYSEAYNLLEALFEEILERLRNSADYQSGHLRMDEEYLDTFELFAGLLIHKKRYEQALTALDQVKNISKFSFYNNPVLKSNILNEEELLYDYVLGNRIERLRNELRLAADSDRASINRKISQAITEKNKLLSRVIQHLDDEPLDIRSVQRNLDRDEMIIYFNLFNNSMYMAMISSRDIRFKSMEFTDDELRHIEQAIGDLSRGRTNLKDLSQIYEKLFEGNLDDHRYSRLYVIPDGFLYRLPVEILPVSNVISPYSYGSARYMIEDYSIQYLNSLKEFQDDNPVNSSHYRDFLGLGISDFRGFSSNISGDTPLTSLPFAELEVEQISNALTRMPSLKILTADESTEMAFRSEAGNSRVIHIASHSEIYHPDPLYSVIYMHGERESGYQNDGFVYAYELFEMNLSNDLVMLSSCESGSGNYIQGSGIVGLSRAFTYAGVRSLVMNLWSIRDQTASEISVRFYEYLNKGYSKDEALRATKIEYINHTNSDPYLWGSFVVYGDTTPVIDRHRNVNLLVIVLGTAVFLGIGTMILLFRGQILCAPHFCRRQ